MRATPLLRLGAGAVLPALLLVALALPAPPAQAQAPEITLIPNLGLAGSRVSVLGEGLEPCGEFSVWTINLRWDGQPIGEPVKTNPDSTRFTSRFRVPLGANAGQHTVGIRGTCSGEGGGSGAFRTARTFTVDAPEITLVPDHDLAGSRVSVVGKGLEACSEFSSVWTINLRWDGQPIGEPVKSEPGSTRFTSRFRVPLDANAGQHTVGVRGTCLFEGGGTGAFRTARMFTVDAPTLSVAPRHGLRGRRVTLVGEGFPRPCATALTLRFAAAAWPFTWQDRGVTGGPNSATFRLGAVVPATAPFGEQPVTVACQREDAGTIQVTTRFVVDRPATTSTSTTSTRPPTTTTTTTTTSRASGTMSSGPGPPPTTGPPPGNVQSWRSLFPQSVRAPSEVATGLRRLVGSLLLTVLLLFLIGYPAEQFNKTFEANKATIYRWMPFLDPARKSRWSPPRGSPGSHLAGFVVLAGLLEAFVDTSIGFDRKSVALVVGMVVAMGVATLAWEGTAEGVRWRASGVRGVFRVLPPALFVAVVCATVSRAAQFLPGYVYGMVAAYAVVGRRRRVGQAGEGAAVLLGALVTLAISLLAWAAWEGVNTAASRPDASFPVLIADAVLCAVFVVGVETVLFGLAPLEFLDGRRLWRWRPGAWIAVEALAGLAFVHVLFDVKLRDLRELNPSPLVRMFVLFVGFMLLSWAFWGFFRVHSWVTKHGYPKSP